MGNFFNIDSPFFTFMGKVCDILLVSIVWVLLCIPVVTIGPANTAMYYAVVKVIRKERGYLFKEFFKSFKLNFKRAAIVGVILTIIFVVLSFDLFYAWNWVKVDNNKGSIALGLFIALTFLVSCFSIFAFPILSRFEMTVKQLFKAAAFMSMRHLPFAILMVVVTAAGIISVLFIYPLMFIVPGLVVFINSLMMERILKKYMPKAEENPEETGKDEWYLE